MAQRLANSPFTMGLAFVVTLIGRENVLAWLVGWVIAAISTLILVISTTLDLRQ